MSTTECGSRRYVDSGSHSKIPFYFINLLRLVLIWIRNTKGISNTSKFSNQTYFISRSLSMFHKEKILHLTDNNSANKYEHVNLSDSIVAFFSSSRVVIFSYSKSSITS